jgi:hypothetical protein
MPSSSKPCLDTGTYRHYRNEYHGVTGVENLPGRAVGHQSSQRKDDHGNRRDGRYVAPEVHRDYGGSVGVYEHERRYEQRIVVSLQVNNALFADTMRSLVNLKQETESAFLSRLGIPAEVAPVEYQEYLYLHQVAVANNLPAADPAYQELIARGILQGIANYVSAAGVTPVSSTQTVPLEKGQTAKPAGSTTP